MDTMLILQAAGMGPCVLVLFLASDGDSCNASKPYGDDKHFDVLRQ